MNWLVSASNDQNLDTNNSDFRFLRIEVLSFDNNAPSEKKFGLKRLPGQ